MGLKRRMNRISGGCAAIHMRRDVIVQIIKGQEFPSVLFVSLVVSSREWGECRLVGLVSDWSRPVGGSDWSGLVKEPSTKKQVGDVTSLTTFLFVYSDVGRT